MSPSPAAADDATSAGSKKPTTAAAAPAAKLCLDPIQAMNEFDFLAAMGTALEAAGLYRGLAEVAQQNLTILAPTNQASKAY